MTDVRKLPRHVAIIMDGNGRWAKAHALKVAMGHRKGVEALRGIIRESSDIGIEALTLYAFSTENWRRSEAEVSALMALLLEYFSSEIDELDEKNVRIRILGDKQGLPAPQREAIEKAEERTKENGGLKLNIAINYGARAEILSAVRTLAQKAKEGEILPEDITEADFSAALYTRDLPDVDLLIRTSGEMRLSNFLLYQCAYAEMVFPKVLWPDFTVADYHAALDSFGARDRRFGGRKE
ncbi:MAG: isoprenyl transferase [Clostridia bacterium]|nr:isoprenyl transferase [Clostridia bacterium]